MGKSWEIEGYGVVFAKLFVVLMLHGVNTIRRKNMVVFRESKSFFMHYLAYGASVSRRRRFVRVPYRD